MRLALRDVLFTLAIPGLGGVCVPWLILTAGATTPQPAVWPATLLIAAGAASYVRCLWLFATVGRGTPATWDAPNRLVTVGPYRWVRNPIYVGAFLIVLGQAWLFLSPSLLLYAILLALGFHALVVGYEEPTLRRRFGEDYEAYRRGVPRWLPRRPKRGSA